jgi:hypothetical protein
MNNKFQFKKILILIFLVLAAFTIVAQEYETKDFKIGISVGGALLFTGELQKINNEAISSSPFNLETINNFPPNFTYGGFVLNKMGKRLALGPGYIFYTTGSRIGVKDYSGQYSFDQIISAHSLSILVEMLLSEKKKSAIFFEGIAGANFASWKMIEHLIIGEESQKDETSLKAIKPFVYPGFKFSRKLNESIGIFLKGGVSIDIAGKFHLAGHPRAKSETKANFSGPRINIGIEYGY